MEVHKWTNPQNNGKETHGILAFVSFWSGQFLREDDIHHLNWLAYVFFQMCWSSFYELITSSLFSVCLSVSIYLSLCCPCNFFKPRNAFKSRFRRVWLALGEPRLDASKMKHFLHPNAATKRNQTREKNASRCV